MSVVSDTSALPMLLKGTGVIGVRREDKSRWERRVPISPAHVATLVSQGIKVIIQPSNLRIFSDDEFAAAGAILQEDLTECPLIIGVKEVPISSLLPNRTYVFFSHTIKAQTHNMPMLDAILDRNIRLVDYERILDPKTGSRLVRFGKYAGYAGMIDGLRALGERLLVLGYSTPFLNVGYSHMYGRLADAKQAITNLGNAIKKYGLPRELCPMVFTFTGATGQVSHGALEIFNLLPFVEIQPADLPNLVRGAAGGAAGAAATSSATKLDAAALAAAAAELESKRYSLYMVKISSKDVMVHKDHKPFDRTHYYANPQDYRCNFADTVAPYTSVIVNNTYWDQRYPRFITSAEMRKLAQRRGGHRMHALIDISCDLKGSIEWMHKCTTIDRPFYVYEPVKGLSTDGMDGKGILVFAVDNLPTELPREASLYFGDSLLPFLPALARSDGSKPLAEQLAELPAEWGQAIITSGGKLTPAYEYITKLRATHDATVRRVLMLGSGMVAKPAVDMLMNEDNLVLTVASNDLAQAQALCKPYQDATATLCLADDEATVARLVQQHDVVISLVPPPLHPTVARLCIQHKKHMVTASYVSPAMRELHAQATAAGITILNECGLDPGIDLMSTMQIVDAAHAEGSTVIEYQSMCGGLPAPEASDNPLGYKFSWSPKGAITAGLNPATFLIKGATTNVAHGQGFLHAKPVFIDPCFQMEVLPNRDSLAYIQPYSIPEVETMFRGTLRYRGWGRLMASLRALGLLTDTPLPALSELTWPNLLAHMLGLPVGTAAAAAATATAAATAAAATATATATATAATDALKVAILRKGGVAASSDADAADRLLATIEFLDMLDPAHVVEGDHKGTILDSFCALLSERLVYQMGERDMVLMHHRFTLLKANGDKEFVESTLMAYGESRGPSAMSRTVGVPVAAAALLLVEGKCKRHGVISPVTADIYEPIMLTLKEHGIVLSEKRSRVIG